MKTSSQSSYPTINGLKYHVRTWGDPASPRLFLFHGWLDMSASYQFLVDNLAQSWYIIAPDWRGFGETQWNQSTYWFPEYLSDLDQLLDLYSPDEPARLVGHSMGGNIASLYAGIQPHRIKALISLEGFGLAPNEDSEAAERYGLWLAQCREQKPQRIYDSFESFAERLKKGNARLSDEQAQFLSRHMMYLADDGQIKFRNDSRHRYLNPYLFRLDQSKSCWRATTAPCLWVAGDASRFYQRMQEFSDDYAERMACYQQFEYQVIADADHMLQHDQPQQLAEIIETFLAKHAPC